MTTIVDGSQGITTTGGFTGTSNLGIGSSTPVVSLDISQKTDALIMPVGTLAQRPAAPTNGMLRYNTTTGSMEFYNGSPGAWQSFTVVNSSATYSIDYMVIAGGGGGGSNNTSNVTATYGGTGGSGIVIIRYANATQRATGGTVVNSGGYWYHTFTGNGTFAA